ncbi:threonine dehydratase [Lysinibacillus composti]|uniref:L-threonine dehydratase n=1 Tax=Lysinibacillus composti TaxID=720633 RepID=A0A3N9UUM5_9BACI|nr:threonine ammonia-lyase IlvA [Lysinibacillus composti]MBM7608969.1 threonine dehydratase [Lysinibacillus composti]RQW75606.1 threonine dehydratase [Lysinibacillus composti]
MEVTDTKTLAVESILRAHHLLKDVVLHTPLIKNEYLSEKYSANIYFKREDLQHVRSFKLRGAYYKIKKIESDARASGVVCASAGNHAQGVAFACAHLNIKGAIFMPLTTPKQKIDQVRMFGRNKVEIILAGDTFDDSAAAAMEYCDEHEMIFIHPFNDLDIIAGQGTVAVEVMNDIEAPIDFIFGGIGGGGLMSGIAAYVKNLSPTSQVIGVEPAGAASMKAAFENNGPTTLAKIDKFCDGTAVQCIGNLTYEICKQYLDDIVLVPEGKVSTTILDLYNKHAIVAEPSGALPVAALDLYADQIKGKTAVAVITGGNNDISRMQEIKEKSLLFEGLLYYFIVNFPQRAGALRQFLTVVLGPNDDITTFEYTKKNSKESGPALVGIEVSKPEDYEGLIDRMRVNGFEFTEINKDSQLFNLLV